MARAAGLFTPKNEGANHGKERLLGGRQYQEAAHPNPSSPGRAVTMQPLARFAHHIARLSHHKIGGARLARNGDGLGPTSGTVKKAESRAA
jgi:hypothetical protein